MPAETRVTSSGAQKFCATCSRSFDIDAQQCPHDGARLITLDLGRDPMLGKVLDGRYEIRARLGSGGMGAVYRGVQLSVDREVAIKLVHPTFAGREDIVKRFLREARLASKLSSPNIVQIIDFGSSEGALFLVMELLRGRALDALLSSTGAFSERRAVHIALQLCDALQAAHTLGIIHRDLKPGNVIVLDQPIGRDALKVLDFGLAKSMIAEGTNLTRDSNLIGTPLYMAPEQIANGALDARTDLYALGCIVHELLTGRAAFEAPTLTAVIAKHMNEPAPRLPATVSPRLAAIVDRLLEKLPDARLDSAAALREHLVALSENSGSLPTAPAMSGVGFAPTVRTDSAPALAAPLAASIALAPTIRADTASAPPAPAVVTIAPVRDGRRRVGVIIGIAIAATAAALVVVTLARGGNNPVANTVTTDARALGVAPTADARVADAARAPTAVPIDAAPAPVVTIDAATNDAAPKPTPVDAAVRPHRDAGSKHVPTATGVTPDAPMQFLPPSSQ